MRRTERLEIAANDGTTVSSVSRSRKPSWVPRARRLRLHTPLRYRAKGQTLWREGVIDNLSQSGVLFRGEEPLPARRVGGDDLRNAGGDFWPKKQQRTLPGTDHAV